jgi:hypothetical protein
MHEVWVDAQEYESLLARVETVRAADDLLRLRAVDEALRIQCCAAIGARSALLLPLFPSRDVKNHRVAPG